MFPHMHSDLEVRDQQMCRLEASGREPSLPSRSDLASPARLPRKLISPSDPRIKQFTEDIGRGYSR